LRGGLGADPRGPLAGSGEIARFSGPFSSLPALYTRERGPCATRQPVALARAAEVPVGRGPSHPRFLAPGPDAGR